MKGGSMSYGEHRQARVDSETNQDVVDHSWEQERCGLLHSGFLERCSGDDSKSVIFLSIWYTKGMYRCKLLDRQNREKTFVDVGTLENLFETLNRMMMDCELEWSSADWERNGTKSP